MKSVFENLVEVYLDAESEVVIVTSKKGERSCYGSLDELVSSIRSGVI